MRKLIGIILCLAVVLTFSACESNKDVDILSDVSSDVSKVTSDVSGTDESSSEETSTENVTTSDKTNESEISPTSSKEETSSNVETKNSSNESVNSTSSTESQPPIVSEEIDSSTEEKIEEQLPENIVSDNTQTDDSDLVLGEDYGAFVFEGTFISVTNDKNIIYSIFKSPNSVVAYDAKNLELLYTMPLPGRPAEAQIDGNNLLISYPDLKCIRVYDKNTFAQIKSISLPNVVSSFCIDGDIIYYSEDDQHCKVYCTNLQTKETKAILNNNNFAKSFYFPKLLLNKELGLLYIGESKSTGSALYYYNTSDLSFHSVYKKDNYGHTNGHRTMFLVNNNVFWGGFRFGADSAENIIGSYSGNSTYHADANFVITPKGIYETETYQYLGTTERAIYMSVTENQSLVAVFQHYPGNVVVVVPYE